MSYSVTYNPELKNQYPPVHKKAKISSTKKVCYALLVVIVGFILVKCGVARYLLPGDPQITISAFSSMIEQVGAGEPIREAVVAFFQDIIVNGA